MPSANSYPALSTWTLQMVAALHRWSRYAGMVADYRERIEELESRTVILA